MSTIPDSGAASGPKCEAAGVGDCEGDGVRRGVWEVEPVADVPDEAVGAWVWVKAAAPSSEGCFFCCMLVETRSTASRSPNMVDLPSNLNKTMLTTDT